MASSDEARKGPTRVADAIPEFEVLGGVDWETRDREVAEERARHEADAEAKRVRDLRHELADHGAPAKDLDRALSGELVDTEAVRAVRTAHERGSTLVAISGPPGVGKTTAAAWWILRGFPPAPLRTIRPRLFVRAAALSRWPRFDEDRMRDLERAAALVIDDLGVEFDDEKGAFRSLLDDVIDGRYAATLPTLITTNSSGDAFAKRYGERIRDRIREAGDFVALRGESMRARR